MNISKMTFRRSGDWLWATIVLMLSAFGLLMIYSASAVRSYDAFGTNSYYLWRQIWWFAFGIIAFLITANINYRFWRTISWQLIVINIILLIIVFIPGFGSSIGGATRWFRIGDFYFQPSEMAKLTFLIYLAAWLDKKGEMIRDFKSGFLPFITAVALMVVLIIKQPDMGTTVVLMAAAAVVLFLSGATFSHLFLGLMGTGLIFLLLIKSVPYRFERLMTFLNPGQEALSSGYHILQSLIAVGSGGLWGVGFGQSRQKFLYLPQAETDSIFAIIGEELGFIRTAIFILVFVVLIFRGLKISRQAPDRFGQLLAAGIVSWIAIQFFVNICAMLGLLPLTGVPLPFISYGGSSLFFLLAASGIVFNISKNK